MLSQHHGRESGWHLLVVRVADNRRDDLFRYLRGRAIGVNVHYGLVYHHPWYRQHFGPLAGCCPVAEHAESEILTLPLFPGLGREGVRRVCEAITEFWREEAGPKGGARMEA
jgi:dTDP-4-amino-4,6-dideoxygalactose transaminase